MPLPQRTKEEKKIYMADYYRKNKSTIKESHKLYYEKNKSSCLLRSSIWAKNNKESSKKIKLSWSEKNPEKNKESKLKNYQKNKKKYIAASVERNRLRRKLRQKIWLIERSRHKTNPTHRAKSAFYRVKRKTGVPKWVKYKDLEVFYKNCPDGFVVDHIIPVKHNDVCGLHVLWNLQYLSAIKNAEKGNKF